jgi:CspA family cold shock protein
MAKTGKILRFDESRGYGFIAPDGGGADVFVHAKDLDDDKFAFVVGTQVEFDVVDGDRGPKAFAVRRIAANDASAPVLRTAPRAADIPSLDEDGRCDVLSLDEFKRELIELLLESSPELTGAQIVRLREDLLVLGRKHGWIEG